MNYKKPHKLFVEKTMPSMGYEAIFQKIDQIRRGRPVFLFASLSWQQHQDKLSSIERVRN
jgi:hypothetical protein